jgi:hypothetical protein
VVNMVLHLIISKEDVFAYSARDIGFALTFWFWPYPAQPEHSALLRVLRASVVNCFYCWPYRRSRQH